jgi:hypothetical protein
LLHSIFRFADFTLGETLTYYANETEKSFGKGGWNMSSYSYKNAGEEHMPCRIKNEGGNNPASVGKQITTRKPYCTAIRRNAKDPRNVILSASEEWLDSRLFGCAAPSE